MGREATCAVTYNGRTIERKVLLETDEVIARGDPRVVVKRADITSAKVDDGSLLLAWKGGKMELALGAREAERWAKEIASPKSRLEKIGVKPGHRVALAGMTDDALPGELATLGIETLGAGAKELDLLFLQVDKPAALSKVATAAKRLAPAGALWIVSPRGVDGLKDTDVMKAGKGAGLVDVKVVRFSETHSANKFVIPKDKRPSSR